MSLAALVAAIVVSGPALARPATDPCSKACVYRVQAREHAKRTVQHRNCGTPACNRRLGAWMAYRRYHTHTAFNCLAPIIDQESGWDATIHYGGGHGYVNGAAYAYGIPQAKPGNQMASAGRDWQTHAATQIRWLFGYVDDRYGGPCGALEHKRATGWY